MELLYTRIMSNVKYLKFSENSTIVLLDPGMEKISHPVFLQQAAAARTIR